MAAEALRRDKCCCFDVKTLSETRIQYYSPREPSKTPPTLEHMLTKKALELLMREARYLVNHRALVLTLQQSGEVGALIPCSVFFTTGSDGIIGS